MKLSISQNSKMNGNFMFLKKILLVIFSVGIFTNLSAQKAWKSIAKVDVPLGLWNENVFAFKESIYYKYTTDGGATIKDMGISISVTEVMGQIHYLNADELFTSTRKLPSGKTFCYASSDGGAIMTKMGDMIPPNAGFIGQGADNMYFFNSKKGLAMVGVYRDGKAHDLMMRTKDGGATWTLATTDTLVFDEFEHIRYHRNGLVRVFADRDIYVSKDYGNTWIKLAENPLSTSGTLVDDGDKNIWGVGWAGTQKPCYVQSTDGGLNFNSWSIPDEKSGGIMDCGNSASSARSIAFVAPNNLVVLGFRASQQDRVTILSEDGGKTWQDATFPTGNTLGSNHVYTSDDGSTFYYSSGKDLLVMKQGSSIGKQKPMLSQFSLYPNPSKDQISVNLTAFQNSGWKMQIHNTLGQLLWQKEGSGTEVLLNRHHLPTAGTYIISVCRLNGTNINQQKLIITE